ncbi:MAG: hypothetical protein L6427_08705 [Actinomycetia bacterium]|nr:hypothetical protein [Actinomycetota bacterium]MCG2795925.1 hypothetical protein [Actinomycetes bacterium]
MTNVKKIVDKACNSPRNIRFRELVTLLTRIGCYSLDSINGSHWNFRRDGYYPITITHTRGHAKIREVKEVVKLLKESGWI